MKKPVTYIKRILKSLCVNIYELKFKNFGTNFLNKEFTYKNDSFF